MTTRRMYHQRAAVVAALPGGGDRRPERSVQSAASLPAGAPPRPAPPDQPAPALGLELAPDRVCKYTQTPAVGEQANSRSVWC